MCLTAARDLERRKTLFVGFAKWLTSPMLLLIAGGVTPCHASVSIQAEPSVFTRYVVFHCNVSEPVPQYLSIYDITGAMVWGRQFGIGGHQFPVAWDGTSVPSGEYFVRLDAGGEHASCRIVRLGWGDKPVVKTMNRWLTARAVSLAGATTAAQTEADILPSNPAQVYLTRTVAGGIVYGGLQPSLWPGMASVAGGARVEYEIKQQRVASGLYAVFNSYGESDVVNERGDLLGTRTSGDFQWGAEASAALLGGKVSLGCRAGWVHSWLVPQWVLDKMPELKLAAGGEADGVAMDFGIRANASSRVSVGLSVNNLGVGLDYTPAEFLETGNEPYPTTLRLGLAYTPVRREHVVVSIAPEVDKVLVGMFSDTTGTRSFGQQLRDELRDAWKSIGFEGTYSAEPLALSARLGYVEDLTGNRGGIVFEHDGATSHVGLGDLLARRGLGRFKSLEFCFGVGIEYARLRLDLGSEHVSDFPTANYKLSLTYAGR
jgi:hypothetical protein